MGSSDYYAEGCWNVICDRCGKKIKSSDAKKTYDGFYTCGKCWYPRHPQELFRGIKDDQSVPFSRPEHELDYSSGYAALYNGACFVYVPTITSTSTVTLTNAYPDGIVGTVTYTIVPSSGFTINSTSNKDMSSYSYTVT